MTTGQRLPPEFGKRRPTPLPPAPGPKRSNHVALLVMGTFAVGSAAFSTMQSKTCDPPLPPGVTAPASPNVSCASRGSSGGSSYSGSSRYGFYDNASGRGSSTSSSESSGGVTRGGFGSFARAFGFGGG